MRKIVAVLSVLLLAGAAWAGFTADPAGDLYQFWLAPLPTGEGTSLIFSKSLDQGTTFSPPQTLYSFTFEVQSCNLTAGQNSTFYLAFETSKESFFTSSLDGGKTFDPPVKITNEAVSSPCIAVDSFGQVHLAYLTEDKNLNLERLYYTAEPSFESKLIFESHDELINPRIIASPWAIILIWQKKYLERKETYLTVSLDQGKHFGSIRSLPLIANTSDLVYSGGKWLYFASHRRALTAKEIEFTPPSAPELLLPVNKTVTRLSSIEITFRPQSPEPLIYKLEFSWYKDFPPDQTWAFDYLCFPGSSEARYVLPMELPEGEYFLRLSAFDGLTTGSPSNATTFGIDRTIPTIDIASPSEEVSEQQNLPLEGKISEPSFFTVNGNPISLEADGKFKTILFLQPGENILNFAATDEAGNPAFLSKKVTYSAVRPEITLLKPKESDWFKPDSAIFVEAAVRDFQDDIEDESEGEIIIGDKILEDKLIYDKKEGKLTGFINLPKELPDGINSANIRLRDAAGNAGEKELKINIDRLPPALTICTGESAYSNSGALITLPLQDGGAGIDRMGTLIEIAGISIEAVESAEAGIALKPKFSLSDGTYEVTVTPRDLIGNSGDPATFELIVDTVPPKLSILSSNEAQTEREKMKIEAGVSDAFLSTVKIYDNNKLVESFTPLGTTFTKEILLVPGNNEIRVEAQDKAGNSACQTLAVFANFRSQAALVTKCGNGPNPFSPPTEMSFTYQLSSPSLANLKIFIFDLSGTLIWKKELTNVSSGSTPWNGRDQFEVIVQNGVYPYIMQFSSSGAMEIERGKIIVLQ